MTQNIFPELRDVLTFNLSSLDLILVNYQDDPFFPEPIKMALEDLKEGFQEALALIASQYQQGATLFTKASDVDDA